MILKADCVLSGAGLEQIEPGLVRIDGNRICQLGRDVSYDGCETVDFRSLTGCDSLAVIAPGLIDCHCHLELSNLRSGNGQYDGSFVRWLGQLVARRPKWRWSQLRAVRSGVRQSLAAGVTTVADISANGQSWRALEKTPIRKVCFAEVIGIGRKRHAAIPGVTAKLHAMPDETDMFLKGISPHAPYSTAEQVYMDAMKLARDRRLRLTTHLAEDPAEAEFVSRCTGPWAGVLKGLRVWDDSIEPRGVSPVAWAERIGLLDFPAVLAHVNYVSADDIDLLARSCASVVYCPSAHRYFRHAEHSYREMIQAGVTVSLGNDSRACSSELSIMRQMQMVYEAGGLKAEDVLAMGTSKAATALQMDSLIGTVEVGKLADLVVMIVARPIGSVLQAVLTGPVRLAAVVVNGRIVKIVQGTSRQH